MWSLRDWPKVNVHFSIAKCRSPAEISTLRFEKVVCGLSLKAFRTSSCLPSAFGKQHLFQNPLSWLKKSQKGTGIPAEHTAGVLERLVECVLCSELGCFPVRGMAGTQKSGNGPFR